MGTLDTKLLIADALVQLCEEQPLKKVSISDIVERTGKNRKTFYYHFEDKNALIIWKFRYDLGLELQHRFPENILVYKKDEDPSLSSFSFYITQKSGVRSLDHSKFFDAFAIVLERNRAFYMQALPKPGPPPCASIYTICTCPPCATTSPSSWPTATCQKKTSTS